MANGIAGFKQSQTQKQVQSFKLSMAQIQGLKFLEMNSADLREEILKAASENPALEIVSRKSSSADSDAYQLALENTEEHGETLQSHLMHQLNSMNLHPDEYELSKKLIYNLDKNGCYGSMISPKTLLDKTRPLQTEAMLERCIDRIQKMDPVGTCCKTPEESLFIQAKISGKAGNLELFILDGHLEFLNPPEPDKILNKILTYRKEWHKKSFANALLIDGMSISEEDVEKALSFILSLNPRPAAGYIYDTNSEYEQPDVVLKIEKVSGNIATDDFASGKVKSEQKGFFFQVKYASDIIPELRISPEFKMDKEGVEKARQIINAVQFRESSLVLQGCAIVKAQKDFFEKGNAELKKLTRRQIAERLGINESTVSRMAGKKSSKYFQTEWGLFPASYFFSSGIGNMSATQIKAEILKITLENEGQKLSDEKIAEILNGRGIKISRRTVTKYRLQEGVKNSYRR